MSKSSTANVLVARTTTANKTPAKNPAAIVAGGVRRKVVAKKTINSKLNLITLEKNIAPYGVGLISNVNAVSFFANEREKQLQFNFPKVKASEKHHLTVLYAKAVQMPEPPSDIMLKEMEHAKADSKYQRKISKLERRLATALSNKLPLLDNYSHVSVVGINIGKTEYKISNPKIYKVNGNDIFLIWGIIERVNNNIIHTGDVPSVFDGIFDKTPNNETPPGTVPDDSDSDSDASNNNSEDTPGDTNTIQLVMDETGLSKQEVERLLAKYDGDMVEAIMAFESEIVATETGLPQDRARELITKCDGEISTAIDAVMRPQSEAK